MDNNKGRKGKSCSLPFYPALENHPLTMSPAFRFGSGHNKSQ